MTTTKFGNKTRSLHTKQTECKLDSFAHFYSYYDVLLLATAYSDYAVHFFLGQFPNMEFMFIVVVVFYFLFNLLYFPGRSI